jgi:hypothetical protein
VSASGIFHSGRLPKDSTELTYAMRFIERGGKRFRVHIRAEGDGMVSVWFVDCTTVEFTRFAVSVSQAELRRKLLELADQLGLGE